MNFIKMHYKKILIILLCLLFFNCCSRSCSKSNELRNVYNELDSISENNTMLYDSVIILNNTLKNKNIELELKNNQIEQLSKTLNTLINKNSINHIKVIIPEKEKNQKINE